MGHKHRCKGGENCHDEEHLCRIIIRKDLETIKEAGEGRRVLLQEMRPGARNDGNLCDPSRL